MTATYRFLFDECLTAELVATANSSGFEATHIRFLGRSGASDRSHAVYAVEADFVFVTNSARDFKRIYRQLALHPGLLVILPSVPRRIQPDYFRAAVERLETMQHCVNLLIEVDADRNVVVADWSSGE